MAEKAKQTLKQGEMNFQDGHTTVKRLEEQRFDLTLQEAMARVDRYQFIETDTYVQVILTMEFPLQESAAEANRMAWFIVKGIYASAYQVQTFTLPAESGFVVHCQWKVYKGSSIPKQRAADRR